MAVVSHADFSFIFFLKSVAGLVLGLMRSLVNDWIALSWLVLFEGLCF
jgi:hypothetical protein